MKKQLQQVLNLGQMTTTPFCTDGVHFVSKVCYFGKRKEVIVCCPDDDACIYKIPLSSRQYTLLKGLAVEQESFFVLIERKGTVLKKLFKIKDYSPSAIWQKESFYHPNLIETFPVRLMALTVEEFA